MKQMTFIKLTIRVQNNTKNNLFVIDVYILNPFMKNLERN